MNVSLSIGSAYSKATFWLEVNKAVEVMAILDGCGIGYKEDNVYEYKVVEMTAEIKDIRVLPKPIPPILPDQEESPINEF